MIAVVDYGMGNLRSVAKGLERVGSQAQITDDPATVRRATGIVLPGQGAFGTAMRRLEAAGLVDVIRERIDAGTPFLGVCLGLQVLFESSEEAPGVDGFGILRGTVVRFDGAAQPGMKIPHMGWNQLEVTSTASLLRDVKDGDYVYFVHSYYAVPQDAQDIAARTDYGVRFASAVHRRNVFATQFRPEKSQAIGLGILSAFGEMAA